jgi:hypothetical protein
MKSLTWLTLPQKLKDKPKMNGFSEQQQRPKDVRRNQPWITLPSGKYELEVVEVVSKENKSRTGKLLDVYVRVRKAFQDSPVMQAALHCRSKYQISYAHENPLANQLGREDLEALRDAVELSVDLTAGTFKELIGKTFACRVKLLERKLDNGRTIPKNRFKPIPRSIDKKDETVCGVSRMVDGEAAKPSRDSGRGRPDPKQADFWRGA